MQPRSLDLTLQYHCRSDCSISLCRCSAKTKSILNYKVHHHTRSFHRWANYYYSIIWIIVIESCKFMSDFLRHQFFAGWLLQMIRLGATGTLKHVQSCAVVALAGLLFQQMGLALSHLEGVLHVSLWSLWILDPKAWHCQSVPGHVAFPSGWLDKA